MQGLVMKLMIILLFLDVLSGIVVHVKTIIDTGQGPTESHFDADCWFIYIYIYNSCREDRNCSGKAGF